MDLSFEQLKAAMIANGIAAEAIFAAYGRVIIDVGLVNGSDVSSLDQQGLIKFITKLLTVCVTAQTALNQTLSVNQKLNCFSLQLTVNSQFATSSFQIKTLHELASTTQVIGGGAGLPPPPAPRIPVVVVSDLTADLRDGKTLILGVI